MVIIESEVLKGDWQGAMEDLRKYENDCLDPECLARANYAYGYLFDQYAEAADSVILLDSAILYYDKVLAYNPHSLQAANSLSLTMERKGQPEKSYRILKDMVRNLPYAVSADRSFELSRTNEQLVSLFEKYDFAPSEIFAECFRMEFEGLDRLASRALIALIARNYMNPDRRPEVISAFLWWINLQCDDNTIEVIDLEILPKGWLHPSIVELNALLTSQLQIDSLVWWKSDLYYKDFSPYLTMARVMINLAKHQELLSSLDSANVLSSIAFQWVSQGMNESLLNRDDLPDEFFEVAIYRGIFLTNNASQIDSSGSEFQKFEDYLFQEKRDAYLFGKSSKIATLHWILALIYIERGQWEGNKFRYAKYQLEQAIGRAAKGQKVGYLQEYYAIRSRSTDEFLNASRSFMNEDDLRSAQRMIYSLQSFENRPKDLDGIIQILKFRGDISSFELQKIENFKELFNDFANLVDTATADDVFRNVQQAKISADVAAQASAYDLIEASVYFHARTIEFYSKLCALYSRKDLERIDYARQSIRTHISIRQPETVLLYPYLMAPAGSKEWDIYMSSNLQKPQTAAVEADLVTAAKVMIHFLEYESLERLPPLEVDNRTLYVPEESKERLGEEVFKALKKNRIVKRIKFVQN